MTEGKKIWGDIYHLADNLAINSERLKYLVEDVIGKRAETVEEANTVLSFLSAVDSKFKSRTITVDEAIEEAKREYKEGGTGEALEATKHEAEQIMRETLGEPLTEGRVVNAELVVDGHWDKTVEIDEGTFKFREEGTALACRNCDKDSVQVLRPSVPECSCPDFQISKQKQEWCKHLKACSVAGYPVKELPAIPKGVAEALVKHETGKQKKGKQKKEEVIAMTVLDKQIEMPIQTPSELILSEEGALDVIKSIIGKNPRKEDVLEIYAGIEEIKADVIISLCLYVGIPYRIIEKETEKTRISIGKIYNLGASQDQIVKYGKIAEILPEVDVVTRCKVTVAAAWKDRSGNTRLSVGVKEEYLTPHDLSDISKRGATFIEAKAITKANKKALQSVLPITHDGLLSKIKEAYGWT